MQNDRLVRLSRPALPVLLAVSLSCALTACKREPVTPPDAPSSGMPAGDSPGVLDGAAPARDLARPALRVTTVDGDAYDLADHRGRWVVVNFWATWCKPCLKEMPELSALDAMREHIEVIGLAYEEIELGEMRTFLEKHPVVYPIAIVDTYDPPVDFETPRGLPMTYLIAPDGHVAERFLGPVTARDIESAIAKATEGEVKPVEDQGVDDQALEDQAVEDQTD